MKPIVDRLEQELADQLHVVRLNALDREGTVLGRQLGLRLTPTYVLFDASGEELWRGRGSITHDEIVGHLGAQAPSRP
jgi:hypothetical protein